MLHGHSETSDWRADARSIRAKKDRRTRTTAQIAFTDHIRIDGGVHACGRRAEKDTTDHNKIRKQD